MAPGKTALPLLILVLLTFCHADARALTKEVVGECLATENDARVALRKFKASGGCAMYDECTCFINYCFLKPHIGRNYWCYLKVYIWTLELLPMWGMRSLTGGMAAKERMPFPGSSDLGFNSSCMSSALGLRINLGFPGFIEFSPECKWSCRLYESWYPRNFHAIASSTLPNSFACTMPFRSQQPQNVNVWALALGLDYIESITKFCLRVTGMTSLKRLCSMSHVRPVVWYLRRGFVRKKHETIAFQ